MCHEIKPKTEDDSFQSQNDSVFKFCCGYGNDKNNLE